ncbi:hypothetical protein PRIPAC_86198 [Pristionchus pacificus]|uniref:PPIase cyclophilin-type domain-containing protein n=1 Tax=Pristionchus pacificus TaxID=54126 RepID=A0A2A6BMC6_PRIPA|nr:hypothetical protein PRIPAC_86198 [Pristionchus pacificus]|eukprot:PDM66921.1 hypothetical protein PRIPAC_48338 [Pristionchus pacificus]
MVNESPEQKLEAAAVRVLEEHADQTERNEYTVRGDRPPLASDIRPVICAISSRIGYRVKTLPLVYFEIAIGGMAAGRLTFEIYTDVCPNASANLIALSTGAMGVAPNGTPLTYQGSSIHAIVPGFIAHARRNSP